jgi:hypothetical protein
MWGHVGTSEGTELPKLLLVPWAVLIPGTISTGGGGE